AGYQQFGPTGSAAQQSAQGWQVAPGSVQSSPQVVAPMIKIGEIESPGDETGPEGGEGAGAPLDRPYVVGGTAPSPSPRGPLAPLPDSFWSYSSGAMSPDEEPTGGPQTGNEFDDYTANDALPLLMFSPGDQLAQAPARRPAQPTVEANQELLGLG